MKAETDPFLALALIGAGWEAPDTGAAGAVHMAGGKKGQREYTRPDPKDTHRLIGGYAPCPLCEGHSWVPLRGPEGEEALKKRRRHDNPAS